MGVEEFSTLNNFNKTGFILHWDRYDFKTLVKAIVLLIWDTTYEEIRRDGVTSDCSSSCPLNGNPTSST